MAFHALRTALWVKYRRGTAESTVKKHISNLLRKTGDPSLVIAVHRVLRASTKR